mmetsp:Transcript_17554/g.30537  ORF Transcript_17554/g.30537 Transcript_17554/m.30537 type:complete len:220 (-) Transcript_17554:29-688(-)
MSIMTTTQPRTFDFERMLVAFECVQFTRDGEAALPDTISFLDAMNEVTLLFDHLGTGFGFVRADVESKSKILQDYYDAKPEENKLLDDMIQTEIKNDTIRKKPPPSAGRTLLRLMWATKFLYTLMHDLKEAYEPNSTKTLKSAVSHAYDVALAEHHGWLIRKGVGVAVNLLPNKDSFIAGLGVKMEKREEYLQRVELSFKPLVDKMYKYYENYSLLDLP